MAFEGNQNSVSDAGVGALCASMAVSGAYMNVRINASGLTDKSMAEEYIIKGKKIEENTKTIAEEVIAYVNSKIT